MLQSLSGMYLSCQENMPKPGAGVYKRVSTRTGFCPLWQCHCQQGALGAGPGLCWYRMEHLEHGTRQVGHSPRARRGALWQPWCPQLLEWGIRDPGQPLTQLLKGWVKDIQHLLCSLTYWRSWVQFFFYNIFNCVMNVGDQLKTCLLEWTWSWDFLVCESLWLLFLLGSQYFREGHKSSYTFSSSLSWLILFFSNLLTKIQYFHHISLFPSRVTPSFWFWLSMKVVLAVQRRVQVLVCWVHLGSRELARGKGSVALIKICSVHCFHVHSKTFFL